MANPYVYYVLTFDGASLMAQATATNQIVFVGAISKATAASSDEDLAGKGKSWYDGKTGEIAAVSATDAVAKIVSIFTASGARQDAKSIAITARLASQSDADAVVFCAKSDPDATAILPGSTDTMADVRFPFNISINASGTVQVTPGASASVADLARFVSLHKAGDPTRGDNQRIMGVKTFEDKICVDLIDLHPDSQVNGVRVNANLVPTEDNVYGLGADLAWSGVRAWEIHTTSLENGLDAAPDAPIGVYASLIPYGNIALGDASHRWRYIYANGVYAQFMGTKSTELNIDCEGSTTGYYSEIYMFCDDPTDPGVRITLQPQNGSASQYFFYSGYFAAPGKNLGYAGGGEWNNIYAKGISLPPLTITPNVSPNTDVPLGCTLLVYLYIGSHAQNVYHAPGTEWNSNGNNMVVGVLTESGFQRMTNYDKIKSGYKFVLLSGAFSAGGSTSLDGTYVPALVMRIA